MLPDDVREIAERKVRQWDEHDKFRDFEKTGEPTEVQVARAYLSLTAKLAAQERELAELRGRLVEAVTCMVIDEVEDHHFAADLQERLGIDADAAWHLIAAVRDKYPHIRIVKTR